VHKPLTDSLFVPPLVVTLVKVGETHQWSGNCAIVISHPFRQTVCSVIILNTNVRVGTKNGSILTRKFLGRPRICCKVVGFEVLTATSMKMAVLWVVAGRVVW
jgi:hypothetical protein